MGSYLNYFGGTYGFAPKNYLTAMERWENQMGLVTRTRKPIMGMTDRVGMMSKFGIRKMDDYLGNNSEIFKPKLGLIAEQIGVLPNDALTEAKQAMGLFRDTHNLGQGFAEQNLGIVSKLKIPALDLWEKQRRFFDSKQNLGLGGIEKYLKTYTNLGAFNTTEKYLGINHLGIPFNIDSAGMALKNYHSQFNNLLNYNEDLKESVFDSLIGVVEDLQEVVEDTASIQEEDIVPLEEIIEEIKGFLKETAQVYNVVNIKDAVSFTTSILDWISRVFTTINCLAMFTPLELPQDQPKTEIHHQEIINKEININININNENLNNIEIKKENVEDLDEEELKDLDFTSGERT